MGIKANTDTTLWTTRPVHGVAGGPLEVVLTDEGRARAFSVGAQVRCGPPSEALLALAAAGGSSLLSKRDGVRMRNTALGRYDMTAWSVLLALGYCERWYDDSGDGVRMTDAGRVAVADGFAEQGRLLERCRRAETEVVV